MRNNHIFIASESYPIITGLTACAIGSALLAGTGPCSWLFYAVTFPFVLLTLFTIYFFRNPERNALCDENTFIAPADGRVVVLEHVNISPLGGRALKISIFMSVFNVHVNRIPLAGVTPLGRLG